MTTGPVFCFTDSSRPGAGGRSGVLRAEAWKETKPRPRRSRANWTRRSACATTAQPPMCGMRRSVTRRYCRVGVVRSTTTSSCRWRPHSSPVGRWGAKRWPPSWSSTSSGGALTVSCHTVVEKCSGHAIYPTGLHAWSRMGHRVRRIDLFGRREGCEVAIENEHFGIETRLRWGYGALRA